MKVLLETHAFARHLIERYGTAEVRTWYFEVWNEPNLGGFWTGTKEDYFRLYETSSCALAAVDSSLRIGGPATSKANWIAVFIALDSACDAFGYWVASDVFEEGGIPSAFSADSTGAASISPPASLRPSPALAPSPRFPPRPSHSDAPIPPPPTRYPNYLKGF